MYKPPKFPFRKTGELYEVLIISALSSCTSKSVALYRITFLPASNTQKLNNAHAAIIPAIGNAVPSVKILTMPDVSAPTANCIAPINADAVPAFLLKGAIESADELGNTNPWQLKKMRIKNMVEYNPRK